MRASLNVSHLALALTALAAAAPGAEAAEPPLDPERVAAIAAMLPERPEGLGRPIADRAAWERFAAETAEMKILERATALLEEPIPEQPDDLYLEFSRNGNRTRWERVSSQRRGRVSTLVLAECVENKGRFLPAIEAILEALCAERTWVMPAHDAKLTNFHGTQVTIDLGSSGLAWNLATADWLLGDRLQPAIRQRLRERLRHFILDPYLATLDGKRNADWWMHTTSNWNSVCLAGVTGTALAQIESREERARFVAAAERYSRNFLKGFTPDGYCSEGLGYWNYGFGHFVLLSEAVRRATGSKLDLLAQPEAAAPATFAARIQIQSGVSPAFADCGVRAQPDQWSMWLLNRRFRLGLPQYETLAMGRRDSLFATMLYCFPDSLPPIGEKTTVGPRIRSWFQDAGILISRPAEGSNCRMAVALKGGNNAEHHNHNDLGSYVVVLGDRAVLLDPGSETYSARTFSARRYESNLLNSYGHPVPVVAGKLQQPGREAVAKVLRTNFTEKSDTLELDLTSAYPVPELVQLKRAFVYSHEGAGSLTVTDQVELTSPQSFGTALVTLGGWRRLDDGALMVYDVDEAVRVEIDTGGAAYTITAEEIREDAPVLPTRIGIALEQPVKKATVTLKITPFEGPTSDGTGNLLRNGGFEYGTWGWNLPRNGQGELSTERAATGKHSLKITDNDTKAGSNVTSGRIPAEAGREMEVSGKVFHVTGEGIGMYVHYLNARGEMLNEKDERGGIAPVGTLAGQAGQWVPFSYRFTTPPETAAIRLWIHSFNASLVEAFLDDLEVRPVK